MQLSRHMRSINMQFSLNLIFVLLSLNLYVVSPQFSRISRKRITPTIDIPDGLLFGAGTSALQIEGATRSNVRKVEDADLYIGRTKSSIERLLSQPLPGTKPLTDSPDISSDSYHKYKEDVRVLRYIGLNFYRFSMSWTRLLPNGYTSYVNQEGVDYYHALLDELERAGVEPMVQLHHFDHPVAFDDYGGWQNEKIIELYKDYAGFVFNEFGHRVKYFLTFNEPNLLCNIFDSGLLNTQKYSKSTISRTYICGHNVLKAHAEAYHLYHNKFNLDRKGQISINLLCNGHMVEEEKDRHLIDIAHAFGCGWFADPIFSETGDYSELLKQRVKETNAWRRYNNLDLPVFSESWIKKIRGTADFFGVSYYTSRIVDKENDPKGTLNFYMPPEARIIYKAMPTWLATKNKNYIVPAGLRPVLKTIKNLYNNPTVHIVENGFADDGQLNDVDRIKFIYAHVKQVIDAINQDQCDVKSYMYWSLIDNFEFWDGYSARFGLAHVDFDSPNRTRTPKESAIWLRNVLHTRKLYIEE